MDSRTNSTYRMLTTVAATLESKKSLNAITDLPALVKAVTELSKTNGEIADLLETTATPAGRSPESTVKSALARGAVASCAELAAALHAYANDNAETELAAKSDFSESDLAGGRESAIVARCMKVVSLAVEVADELDDYGYTPQDVTAIGKAVEAFAKSCPTPRQGVASRSSANKEIAKLVRKGRSIVTKCIDKLALQLRKTAPAVYDEFKAARKVVNLSGTARTGQPLALTVTPEAKKAA